MRYEHVTGHLSLFRIPTYLAADRVATVNLKTVKQEKRSSINEEDTLAGYCGPA